MWIVTKWCKDYTDSGKDEYTGNLPILKGILKRHPEFNQELYKFRLLDDDNIIGCYGYSNHCDDEKAFAPLDKLMNLYGFTLIEYYNKKTKKYELL